MFDIVGVAVLVGLAVALGWLGRRDWLSTRRVVSNDFLHSAFGVLPLQQACRLGGPRRRLTRN